MGRLPAARPTPSTIRSRKRRAKLEARPKRAERPKERRASSRDEVRSSMRPVPAELDETLGPVAEELEAFAASCKREFDKARKARESASVIASLAASYRGALKALAELRPVDPAAVAESALAQSPQFRSFVAMIMETLARWSPNGYAAVTRELGPRVRALPSPRRPSGARSGTSSRGLTPRPPRSFSHSRRVCRGPTAQPRRGHRDVRDRTRERETALTYASTGLP
jgi:hypothetical protein